MKTDISKAVEALQDILNNFHNTGKELPEPYCSMEDGEFDWLCDFYPDYLPTEPEPFILATRELLQYGDLLDVFKMEIGIDLRADLHRTLAEVEHDNKTEDDFSECDQNGG